MINYWKKGCKFLLKNDPIFINYYNSDHFLKLNNNKFDVLFKSICSQQISVSAAMAIYNISKNTMGSINYLTFKNKSHLLSKLPLTNNKKKSIKSLITNYDLVKRIKASNSFLDKPPNHLKQIFGIGPWTIDMFSIFYLGLSNIKPIGDLGFINAYKKYYSDKNMVRFTSNSIKWGNFSTIVTWYLWASYDSEPLYL